MVYAGNISGIVDDRWRDRRAGCDRFAAGLLVTFGGLKILDLGDLHLEQGDAVDVPVEHAWQDRYIDT